MNGLFFKLGAAPLHFWLPDVYEGVPTIVTCFFSIFPKLVMLIFSLKIFILVTFFIWVRGSVPRYRYDQLMHLGWKSFLPVALALVIFLVSLLFLIEILIWF